MQSNKLFIENLDSRVTKEDLFRLFSGFGTVDQIKIIEGEQRALVVMSSHLEAKTANSGLDGKDFSGRSLRVKSLGDHEVAHYGLSL